MADLKTHEIITPDVRLSFPALFKMKPKAKGSDKLAFSACLLLPPGTNMKPFADAVKAAMMTKFGKLIPLPPGSKANPIKPCAGKSYAGFEDGWNYIQASADRQPAVVDQRRVPVTDEKLIYPGMWVRAYLQAYGWGPNVGGSGVSFGLRAIQIVRDDERLDGMKNAEEVFEALEMPASAGDPAGSGDDDFNPFG